ncbi:MAG: flagellar basal body P-ring protein FlgI [bacterium]|nr:flagellar basal body P-ring protein FlgI [bacterium]
MLRFPSAIAFLLLLLTPIAEAARIKDLTDFQGVRSNPLIGYGLVVGLQGTGDSASTLFANRSLAGLLAKLGIVVDPALVNVTNVAAVMVTAQLPPFARMGEALDVTVSSIGDSGNLQGGTLLATPLLGVDGEVYALAQGPVSIGGFSAQSGQGDVVQNNHPTVARIPRGALVEKEIFLSLDDREQMRLVLHEKDFTTAARIAEAINKSIRAKVAHATDSGSVDILIPEGSRTNVVPFLAQVEDIEVIPDRTAAVVLNERTGTVVIGSDVRISAVAISHGSLSIRISARTEVSQPPPFAETGNTVEFNNDEIVVQEQGSNLVVVQGVTIGELVRTLNSVGASPRDLIAILQAMRAAGALQAELRLI